jgi:hypothetical protein
VLRHLLQQGVLITTFSIEVIVVKKVSARGGEPVLRTTAAGKSGTSPAPPGSTTENKDNDTQDDEQQHAGAELTTYECILLQY